jgi:hypothetical protein
MAVAQSRTSCRSLFKQLEILPVPCQYILSLLNFIINNQGIFQTNSSIHDINTRNRPYLHRPNANLSRFIKSMFYSGIKIFNSLPPTLKVVKNDKAKLKTTLSKYLHTHSFYSVGNLFMCKDDINIFVKC